MTENELIEKVNSITENYKSDIFMLLSSSISIGYQQGREEKCDKCDYFLSVEEAYKKGANRALELAVDLGYMSMDGWDAVEEKMLKE